MPPGKAEVLVGERLKGIDKSGNCLKAANYYINCILIV